jgi:hypothetical protein
MHRKNSIKSEPKAQKRDHITPRPRLTVNYLLKIKKWRNTLSSDHGSIIIADDVLHSAGAARANSNSTQQSRVEFAKVKLFSARERHPAPNT